MKKFILWAAGILLLVGCIEWAMCMKTTDPADFIPQDTVALIYCNTDRLTSIPWIREFCNDLPDQDETKGVKVFYSLFNSQEENVFSGPLYFAARNENQAGFYAQINISAKALPKFISERFNASVPNLKFSETTMAGHKTFLLTDVSQPEKPNGVGITYLANDVVVIFPIDATNAELIDASTGGCPLLSQIDRKQAVELLMKMDMIDDDLKELGITLVDARLNLIGKSQKGMELAAALNCTTKEKAQEIGMECQMMTPMMLGMIFGKDQTLANEVIQKFQITTPSDTCINFSLSVSEATMPTIINYLKNPANWPDSDQ